MLEGIVALLEEKKNNNQSHLVMNAANYNNNLIYWCNSGTDVIGVTGYFSVAFKAHPMHDTVNKAENLRLDSP